MPLRDEMMPTDEEILEIRKKIIHVLCDCSLVRNGVHKKDCSGVTAIEQIEKLARKDELKILHDKGSCDASYAIGFEAGQDEQKERIVRLENALKKVREECAGWSGDHEERIRRIIRKALEVEQ